MEVQSWYHVGDLGGSWAGRAPQGLAAWWGICCPFSAAAPEALQQVFGLLRPHMQETCRGWAASGGINRGSKGSIRA